MFHRAFSSPGPTAVRSQASRRDVHRQYGKKIIEVVSSSLINAVFHYYNAFHKNDFLPNDYSRDREGLHWRLRGLNASRRCSGPCSLSGRKGEYRLAWREQARSHVRRYAWCCLPVRHAGSMHGAFIEEASFGSSSGKRPFSFISNQSLYWMLSFAECFYDVWQLRVDQVVVELAGSGKL